MRLIALVLSVFIGGVVFAIPNMTRRELLFAIPVPPGFRDGPAGRRAILMFRAFVAAFTLAGIIALLLSPNQFLDTTATVVPIAIVFAGVLCYYWQNRRMAPFAVQFALPREVELTTLPERLPRFTWLAIGPFVILAAAAAWLFFNWQRIPGRWAEPTTRGVYGPLLVGAELCAWIFIMALACWFGSRRLRSRPFILGVLVALQYLFGVFFALLALQPLLGIPVWVIALWPIALLIPMYTIMTKKLSEPSEPMDSTPNECWKASFFYYNPNDAALLVEKRDGLGYTFNFANRWSWALLTGFVLIIASTIFG